MSIVVYFQAYQDYIAANLCVNRFRPELKCNGQCYLMKKLRSAEKRNSTPVVPDIQKCDFISPEILVAESQQRYITKGSLPPVNDLLAVGHTFEFFHPPKA